MTAFADSLALTTEYLTAQEKRAQIELEDSLLAISDSDLQNLSSVISKRADAQTLTQHIQVSVKTAKARQGRYVNRLTKLASTALVKKADLSAVVEKLRQLSNTPLGTAALGGAVGATAGGASGLLRGKGLRGAGADALRGGVAGAALGGGAGIVANRLRGGGVGAVTGGDSPPLDEINSAINAFDVDNSSNYLGMAAGGLGWGYGVNTIDNALASRSPAAAFAAANVGNYKGRSDLLNRLQTWVTDNSNRPGTDSVDAFSRLLSHQTNNSGQKKLFRQLSNELADGNMANANSLLQTMLNKANLSGSAVNKATPEIKADIDAIARALNETRPVGWQALPANLTSRLSSLIPDKIPFTDTPMPFSGRHAAIAARKTRTGKALSRINDATSLPIMRGRPGALLGLGVLGAGLGADIMSGASGGDVTPSAEDLQRIREQFK